MLTGRSPCLRSRLSRRASHPGRVLFSAIATRVLALMLVAGAVGASGAQAGRAAVRRVSDGAYTDAQAERGKTAYEQNCSFCHLSDLRGQGFAPALIEDTFAQRWQDGNLGDLFTIVKMTMPQDKPASLTDTEYGDIVAYLLKANNYVAGRQELVPDPVVLKDVTFKKLGAP
jgi:S-disulfanyl-L-cysteine oxidoreductase SoxD